MDSEYGRIYMKTVYMYERYTEVESKYLMEFWSDGNTWGWFYWCIKRGEKSEKDMKVLFIWKKRYINKREEQGMKQRKERICERI